MTNYTIGRGEVHFARFASGTTTPMGFRYIGNTPEFSLTFESTKLDHFNSDRGIREKDASVTIEVARSGQITTDEIDNENVSMFLFSAAGAETIAVAGGAVTNEVIADVVLGRSYPLGVSDSDPVGALSVAFPGSGGTLFTVKNSGGTTTYTAGTDYVFNTGTGLLTPLEGGTITAGSDIKVNYTELAYNYELVKSGSEPVAGALKFITFNPIGEQRVYTLPYVSISPNGDYNLKGDEWQQLPFNFEILRKGALEAVYVNGAPFTP